MAIRKKTYYYKGIQIIKWFGKMVDDPAKDNHYFYQTYPVGGQNFHIGNWQHKTLKAAKEQASRLSKKK